tara:strand:+ start:289 stop:2079 length:1791 start_codon:yes stop_codon:yes gene_type:complete
MDKILKINIFKFFSEIFFVLEKKTKPLILFLILILALITFLDVLSIGLLAFFISVITNPDTIISKIPFSNIRETAELMTTIDLIFYSSVIIITLIFFKNLCLFGATIFENFLRKLITTHNGKKILEITLKKDYNFFLNSNIGNIKNEIFEENDRATAYIFYFISILKESLLLIFILSVLVYTNPKITLIVLLSLLSLTYLIVSFIKKKIFNYSILKKKNTGKAFKILIEIIENIQFIKISKKSNIYVEKYFKYLNNLTFYSQILKVINLIPKSILEISSISGLLLFAYILLKNGTSTDIIIATLSFLVLATIRIYPSLTNLNTHLNGLIYTRPALTNFIENIKANSKEKKIYFKDNIETIDFCDVDFKFNKEENLLLKNIKFSINLNETVGLIGKNGSGKSTVCNLLLGLLKPTSGKVMINNKYDLSDLSNNWHEYIGLIPQNIFLLDDTIENNVAFGVSSENIDKQKLDKALELSFCTELSNKFNLRTKLTIGDKGNNLSGGEKQRLAIARALYNDPKVLIFDEPSIALDQISKELFIKVLKKVQPNKMVLIISHDSEIIKHCDNLISLKQGILSNVDQKTKQIAIDKDQLGGLI